MRTKSEEWEAEEDKKLAQGLKLMTAAWVGMWWIKNVVKGGDLEKLKEEMEKT